MDIDSEIKKILKTGFAEDIGKGDITSNSIISENATGKYVVVAREKMVFCGTRIISLGFAGLKVKLKAKDGKRLPQGAVIAEIDGKVREILKRERTVLNLIQFSSAIATHTASFVAEIKNSKTKILDTRKTVPGLRLLAKYAVKCGGGENHRLGLYDMIIIKDNHIRAAGGISKAVKKARRTGLKIEVECDSLKQVREAMAAKPDIILADNMTVKQLRETVKLVAGKCKIEASGNVTLKNVRAIAKTGVDFISTSKITFAVPPVDIGLDEI